MYSSNSSEKSTSNSLFSGEEPTYSQLPEVVARWDRERKQFSWESSSFPVFSGEEPTNSQLPGVVAASDREQKQFSWESSSFPLFSGEEPTNSQLPEVVGAWDRERTQFSWESEVQPHDDIELPKWRYESDGIPKFKNIPTITHNVLMPLEDQTLRTAPTKLSDTSTEVTYDDFNWSVEGGVNYMADQFAQQPEDLLDMNEVLEIERRFGFRKG